MGNKSMMTPTPKMSKEELKIVRFIVQRLTGCYCDSRGRPVYSRSMNRVMNDVFGVKKFTGRLESALRSQPKMVQLMNELDLSTVWNITRSAQHYRMLATLVAIDKKVCSLQKSLDKIAAAEPALRPTKKYRKISNEIKQYQKRYRQCVKLMRQLFDIKRKGDNSDLLDFATQWRDQMRPGTDYFGYFDDYGTSSGGAFNIESMRDFIDRDNRKTGAFGIFDGLDDDGDYFDTDGDGTDEMLGRTSGDSTIDRLVAGISDLIDRKLEDAGVISRGGRDSVPDYSLHEEPEDPYAALLAQNAKLMEQNNRLSGEIYVLRRSGYQQPPVRHEYGGDIYMGEPMESAPSGYTIEDMMGSGETSGPRPESAPQPQEPSPEPAEDSETSSN